MSSYVEKQIFKGRLSGDKIRIKMPFFKYFRTKMVIELWEAGVIEFAHCADGFTGAAFTVKEDMALQYALARLHNWLDGYSVIYPSKGEELIFGNLAMGKLLAYYKTRKDYPFSGWRPA